MQQWRRRKGEDCGHEHAGIWDHRKKKVGNRVGSRPPPRPLPAARRRPPSTRPAPGPALPNLQCQIERLRRERPRNAWPGGGAANRCQIATMPPHDGWSGLQGPSSLVRVGACPPLLQGIVVAGEVVVQGAHGQGWGVGNRFSRAGCHTVAGVSGGVRQVRGWRCHADNSPHPKAAGQGVSTWIMSPEHRPSTFAGRDLRAHSRSGPHPAHPPHSGLSGKSSAVAGPGQSHIGVPARSLGRRWPPGQPGQTRHRAGPGPQQNPIAILRPASSTWPMAPNRKTCPQYQSNCRAMF